MIVPIPMFVPGGQLTTTANTTLYTVPSGTLVRLDPVVLVNTDIVSRTVNLYVLRSGATTPQRITPKNLSLNAGSSYESIPLSLVQGDSLQGDASANSVVDFTINGWSYIPS